MCKKITVESFNQRANQVHGNKYDYLLIFAIKNNTSKLPIYCNTCEQFFQQTARHHLCRQQGCPKCGGKMKISLEDFKIRGNILHNNQYDYSGILQLKNTKTKVQIRHVSCNGVFKQTPSDHLYGGAGCPYCRHKTENAVFQYYRELYDNVTTQKTFDQCRNPETNSLLKFDIFIPQYNLVIEVMGQQHFKQIRNWDLSKIQMRDNVKEQYCKDNNINYIAIDQEDIYKNVFQRGKFNWKSKIQSAIQLIDNNIINGTSQQNTFIHLKIGTCYNNF